LLKLALHAIEAALNGAARPQVTVRLDRNQQQLEAGFLAGIVADDGALDALSTLDLQPSPLAGSVVRAESIGDVLNGKLGSYGVALDELNPEISDQPDIRITVSANSECGGAANGVLGCAAGAGN